MTDQMQIIAVQEFDWDNRRVKAAIRIDNLDRIAWIPMDTVYVNPMEAERDQRS